MGDMSVTPDSVPPSFGERRGHRLAPLQTNFSRPTSGEPTKPPSRLQRPRPQDYPSTNGSRDPIPLQSPVKRQTSKSSLRNLFARDKPARAAAPNPKLAEIEEAQPAAQTVTVADNPLSPDVLSPQTVASSFTLTSPTTPKPLATLKTARPAPQPVVDSKQRSQEQYGWKPPPLFQAYPQSFKHECLAAPAISADSILRLHATMGKSESDSGRTNSLAQDEAADAARKKKEQKERKHTRTLSSTINKVEWTKKVYVLSTTGYILQYAGEGKNDRLPERMLPLGPKSVAFASDAIPGKHWVLQISQNSTPDTGPESSEPSKPRLRFGFHRANTRRLASSFLLVFDNPESMISWLTVVRTEIEARGGPKLTSEKHSEDDEMPEPQIRSKSSVRKMVKKDPHRVSSLFLQPVNLQSPHEEDDSTSARGMTYQSRRSSYVSVNRRSIIDSRTGSMSTSTSDAHGSSFTSTDLHGSPPDVPLPHDMETTRARDSPTASQNKRQSLFMSQPQAVPNSTRPEHVQASSPPAAFPEELARSASPPAPNFSVPLFSKKFAARPGLTPIVNGQPASVAGVLRRGESTEFNISNMSSPPQSPTYSVASSRHTESSEPSFMPLDATSRRTLRTFNSEDALSRMVRSGQPAPNFSRVPRASDTSSPPSRPLSLVGRSGSGLGIQLHPESQMSTMSPPLPPPEPAPTQPLPSLPIQAQAPYGMSRRKSMPGLGLSMGPPAPPPNCPLPKIPPSIAAQAQAQAPTPTPRPANASETGRFYGSQQVREHVQDRRKSNIEEFPPPRSGKLTKTAARQSRMILQ
ncbi:hypothetical protein N7523_009960 [Penicillium sp. IBT 18751x]|nr:hypothetical protein N7523_009960 [Penicillium sp. IBT 18751x]